MATVTPFLWYDDDLGAALDSYGRVFGDIKADVQQRTPDGGVFVAAFEIAGQRVMAMNAGPGHPHTDAFSFFVSVQGQDEVDRYWDAFLADGGSPTACGWLDDRFGISWQIVPEELMAAVSDSDPAKAEYARQAMYRMQKIVIADLTDPA